jgi:hypothetical protein
MRGCIAGRYLYYHNAKDGAASVYNFLLAVKEQNDANQEKLNKAITGEEVKPINCVAMYDQALLAQSHGTPGYVLIASICFWIASYHQHVTKIKLTTMHYYQLAVQNLYCAHILKSQCAVAIANVRFSCPKQPPPITNEYSFFSLLTAIESGHVESMIDHVQKKAGTQLLGKLEIDLARGGAKRAAIQFTAHANHHPEVPVNDGTAPATAGPGISMSMS